MAPSNLNSTIVVSVIIPTHNHASYLWEALNSVVSQSYVVPYEIIVVDDASTDNAWQVAAHFGAKYYRLEAHNVCVARNFGLAQANGSIVIYLDADNYLLPNFLADTVPLILSGKYDVVYGRYTHVGTYDHHQDYLHFNTFGADLNSLRLIPSIDTCSAIRKSTLSDAPWDPKVARYTDWDFHLTNLERGLRYCYVAKPLFAYRHIRRTEIETRNLMDLTNKADKYIREKHRLNENPDGTELSILLPSIGRYYCFEDWIEALWQLDYPKSKIDLLIIDNSNDVDFFENKLLPFVNRAQEHYHGVAIRRFYGSPIFQPHVSNDLLSQKRALRAAEIMNFALDHINTPYLFNLDDDTTCTPDTLSRLFGLLQQNPEAAGAAVVQRSRRTKYAAVAYEWQNDQPLNLFYNRGSGVAKLTTIGTGCILYPTVEFERFRFTEALTNHGIDMIYGYKLHLEGRYLMTDWSIEAPHHVLSPTGRHYTLTFSDFDQPEDLFPVRSDEAWNYVKPKYADGYRFLPANIISKDNIVCLYHIQHVSEVTNWFKDTLTNHDNVIAVHLFAQDEPAYESLRQYQWPDETRLHHPAVNRLQQYNEIIGGAAGNVIISSVHFKTIQFPVALASAQLNSEKPIILAVADWRAGNGQPSDYYLAFNHLSMHLGYLSNPNSGNWQAVGSLDFCLINAKVVSSVFDPIYHRVPFLAALALQLAANKAGVTAKVDFNCLIVSDNPVERSESTAFYRLVGRFVAREIPYRRWWRWYRSTIIGEWQTPLRHRFSFWSALLQEAYLKASKRSARYRIGLRT